jgi:hypothetical protein
MYCWMLMGKWENALARKRREDLVVTKTAILGQLFALLSGVRDLSLLSQLMFAESGLYGYLHVLSWHRAGRTYI